MTLCRHSIYRAAALVLGALSALSLGASVAHAEAPTTRTYTLIVAHNGSVDEGVAPLRYADDDGARYHETFSQLTDETRLLTVLDADSQRVFPQLATQTAPPTRKQLAREITTLRQRIKRERAQGHRVEVYLVFTGHGNIDASGEGYLSLADGKLTRSDLYRDVIRPLEADYTHLIIDACHAYFMVQSRGGNAWEDDRSGESLDDEWRAYVQNRKKKTDSLPSTVGVILSTSGTAEVHEWSKLRAGVFSHQLRSGLLGGADVNGDGSVDYLELEAFLAAANAGVTNPRARISVYAKPPAQDRHHALAKLSSFRDATTLTLPGTMQGHYHVEDARGLRYADMNLSAGQSSTLVLLQTPVGGRDYFLRREGEQARMSIGEASIDATTLAFTESGEQARSSVEESFRAELFSTPFGPGFYAGYLASRARYEGLVEAQGVRTEPSRRWRPGVSLEYHAGRPTLRERTGLQHNLTLSVPMEHVSGWSLGPYLGYGHSRHEVDEQTSALHRISLGAQLARRIALSPQVWLAPRARLGYQNLILSDSALCGERQSCVDPLGMRASTSMTLGFSWASGVDAYLHGGASLDVITRSSTASTQEDLNLSPMVGLGVAF